MLAKDQYRLHCCFGSSACLAVGWFKHSHAMSNGHFPQKFATTPVGVLVGGSKPWYQLQRERKLPASTLSNLAWSVARPISVEEAAAPQERITPGSVRPVIAKREVHTFAAKRKRVKDYSSDSSGTERETGDGHVENRIYRARGEKYDYYVYRQCSPFGLKNVVLPDA